MKIFDYIHLFQNTVLFIPTLCLIFLFCVTCSVSKEKDEYEVKSVRVTNKILPHGMGSISKLYYKEKEICSILQFEGSNEPYRLSPDKSMIVYICSDGRTKSYQVYNIIEDKKIIFPFSHRLVSFINDEYHKTEWYADKIIISYGIGFGAKKCILHLKDSILEKRGLFSKKLNIKSFDEFYEYLIIMLKQLYDRLIEKDRIVYGDILLPYIKKYPVTDFITEVVQLDVENNIHILEDIGEVYKFLIKQCRSNYENEKIFKIFEKCYINSFEEIDGNVKLRKDLNW